MVAFQGDLNRLDALKSIMFVEVDDLRLDVYEAIFDNGALVFSVAMEPGGKIPGHKKDLSGQGIGGRVRTG
jgi:hypothetical protein